MSSTNRRDSSRAVRAIPKASHFDEAATQLDARTPRFPDGDRRHGEIPSFVTPVRSSSSASARRSAAPAPAAHPNVIPFTKPRAIAAVAAANPAAVVTMAPASTPARTSAPPFAPTKMMTSPPATSAPSIPPSMAPRIGPATPVGTGWTPPHAVKAIAQPASPRAASIAVTAWPAASPAAPAQAPAQSPAQAPAQAPAQSHPVVTTRPASQMQIAQPMATPPGHPAIAAPPLPAPPSAAPPSAAPRSRWAIYEQLGLGPPKPGGKQAAALIVNAYRLLGFGILTIIVFVLIGYIVSTAFYYFSNSWIVPMAVSPTDEKVVTLQAQLAEQQNARDRIADELQQAERAIAVQQTFQAEFAKAIRSDLEGRKLALSRVRELATTAARTRAAIKSQNTAYANASRRRMSQEYAAGLIDRNAMLSGKYQIAQISSSNLSLAERQAEFETRAAELEAQTRSLDAILANAQGSAGTALSYEVLRIKQEYEASRLDLAKATEARDTLKTALARQDKIVAALSQSAYLRAVRDGASVAFVPYGNLSNVEQGTSLYGCKLGMVFCYKVGEVLEVLPGEVQFKHPHRERNLRGQIVVLRLDEDEANAAADDVLFVGGRPILF